MSLVSKQLELGEGFSVSLTRPESGPQFYIFDPSDDERFKHEGIDSIIFLVPRDKKSMNSLSAKLMQIGLTLKMEAAKLPK